MSDLEYGKKLQIKKTTIPGLLLIDLPVHGDSRGWFKENWQREKKVALGLPDFGPVQNNVSFNAKKGVTRGIHAEPWDKYISVVSGKIFGAWVDLREGDTFGTVFTAEIDSSMAIYVPRGVGNAFQALEDNTIYSYLVNDHWSESTAYTFLNLADDTVNISWPIPLKNAELSDKDKSHPLLKDVVPMRPKRTLITGANTKLGKALSKQFPHAELTTKDELDISSNDLANLRQWRQYETIINASEYSEVDMSETSAGSKEAWENNAHVVANLASVATKYRLTLIHFSSDYVFDGKQDNHSEDEIFSPLNVFGHSKAAGDIAASITERHYIIRTGWIVGEGRNFVDTMRDYAEQGLEPFVVDDQIGRMTFADDLAKATGYIIENELPYGTYNFTNSGKPASWADIAKEVYKLLGHNPAEVTPLKSNQRIKERPGTALRPLNSVFNLQKITDAGFEPEDWRDKLRKYLRRYINKLTKPTK